MINMLHPGIYKESNDAIGLENGENIGEGWALAKKRFTVRKSKMGGFIKIENSSRQSLIPPGKRFSSRERRKSIKSVKKKSIKLMKPVREGNATSGNFRKNRAKRSISRP
jgi:hypothetical protein